VLLPLLTLAICLCGIVTLVDDQIRRLVVLAATEVAVQDSLGTICVSLLGIQTGTGHVGNHGVSSTVWVLDRAEWVFLRCWLWEPHITTIAAQLTRLDGLGDVLLDDDGATGSVNEPCTLLHLGDQLLVEETSSLLVERAVDGDDIALGQHLFEVLDTSAANLLLNLWLQWLVIEVKELLALKGLESAEHTLTNTADSDSTDDLVLKIVLTLGDGGNVPVTSLDLLVSWDEVSDEDEDGHDDVLSNRHDIGASDLSDGDTTIGLVGSVEIDVVRSNTSSDGELELLGFGETLGRQVARVEGCGNYDLSVDKLLIKFGVFAFLIRGGDQSVTLILEPFPNTELVFSGSQKFGHVFGVLATVVENSKNFDHFGGITRKEEILSR